MLRGEVEPIILMNELIKQEKELEKILSKYGVKEPEEIERKIERGEIPRTSELRRLPIRFSLQTKHCGIEEIY